MCNRRELFVRMALFIAGLLTGEMATFGMTLIAFAAVLPMVGESAGSRVVALLVVNGASFLVWARWIRPHRNAFALGSGVGAICGTLGAVLLGLH